MNTISKAFFKNLISRGIIKPNTEIDASYRGRDMAGDQFVRARATFVIRQIVEETQAYQFVCAGVRDGHVRTIPMSAITMIDGMVPERVSETYGVRLDGEIIVPGKRRGRKPKNRLVDAAIAEPDPADALADDAEDDEDADDAEMDLDEMEDAA